MTPSKGGDFLSLPELDPVYYFNDYINMKINDAVVALGALSHATRLEVFRLLVKAGDSGLPVRTIADQLAVPADGRLSFHLKELLAAGLASSRQEGRFVYYAVNYPAMNDLLRYLTEDCCAGVACGEPLLGCDGGKGI
jgi:ArsR family transcriptional regulator